MKRRIAGLAGVTAVVAAASLLVAGTTSAGSAAWPTIGCSAPAKKPAARTSAGTATHFVRGFSPVTTTGTDNMQGSLVGTYSYADAVFDPSSYSYDPLSGMMKFKLTNERFTGTVNGVAGTLTLTGTIVQWFKPGTSEADAFEGTGWKSGGCYHEIVSGEDGLASATGFLIFKDRSFGGDADYWGVIRL
jgi:hypothetical protein